MTKTKHPPPATRHSPPVFRSIKWQLLVWQTVLLAGVLLTLLTLHYQLHKRDLIAAVDADLQETLLAVMPAIAPPVLPAGRSEQNPRPSPHQDWMDIREPKQQAEKLLAELEQHNTYIYVKSSQGIKQYGHVPALLTEQIPEYVSKPVTITRDGNRERIQPQHNSLIIVGRPLDDVNAEMAILLGKLILIGCAILLTGFGVGLLIICRALRPIKTISETAKTIASGKHHKRIELADAPEELESMAHTLNDTFEHLDEMIENHKRFSADASHELRTPIAVVIAQAEAALKRERSVEEYQNSLKACLRAGQRMKNMAESLLTLTRIDSRSTALPATPCDLNDLLSGTVDSASLLSEKHPVDFQRLPALSEAEGEKPLTAKVDPDRIHQAVMNLLTNAIQHNPDGCAIHVSLDKQNEIAVITVSDEGNGIAEEHLPHLFERFYRVDKSRSRDQGGAGLGLSIVQSLIEAHGGTIRVSSESGRGTVFTITLPV